MYAYFIVGRPNPFEIVVHIVVTQQFDLIKIGYFLMVQLNMEIYFCEL